MIQPATQNLPRVVKLDHNLREQTDWLKDNFDKAYYAGFSYAHTISKDITAPKVYNFDNPSRRASNNSTLASLSEVGDFELQLFRMNESPCRNGHPKGKDLSVAVGSLYSSFPAFVDGQDGQEQNGYDGSSNNNLRRAVAGSFLGSAGGGNQTGIDVYADRVNFNSKNSSVISRDSNHYNDGKTSNQQGSICYGDRTEHKTVPIYPASHNSHSSNISHNNSNYIKSSSSSSAHGNMAPPKSSYSDDITDSQLAVFDMDGKHIT